MTRVSLYRHFDKDGALLYIGMTCRLQQRQEEHQARVDWHALVCRSEITWFDCRNAALAAEALAIKTEKPRYNIQHRAIRNVDPAEPNAVSAILADEMQAAASGLGISITTMGARVGQGGKFYERLRSGKRVWPETVEKVRSKMRDLVGESTEKPKPTGDAA